VRVGDLVAEGCGDVHETTFVPGASFAIREAGAPGR
jgi:hypothetical protein